MSNTFDSAPFTEVLSQSLAKTQQQSVVGVEKILSKKLPPTLQPPDFAGLWQWQDYGLDQVQAVQQASSEAQHQLLALLARKRFEEAYFIEKAGMSYAAKMSLLSESLNEQKLYSLFAAEEASHFQLIDSLLGEPQQMQPDPFIELLNGMIQTGSRRGLILMIQVVLEGWGLDHYSLMMKSCRQPAVQAALRQILSDEAAHHGSGVALFEESALSPAEFQQIVETLQRFLSLVQIGPVGVLGAIGQVLGESTAAQRSQILSEMQALPETARKLNLLKGYLLKVKAHRLLASLEEKGCFQPQF